MNNIDEFSYYGDPASILQGLSRDIESGRQQDKAVFTTISAIAKQIHDLALPPTGFRGSMQVRGNRSWVEITVQGRWDQ